MAYYTLFVPSVKYTLPQSFHTRTALDQAQTESLGKIIAKCGFNRNTARAIIFAPTSYAGGEFLPWYLLQGEGQVTQFLKHWCTRTIVSSTLRIAVCWAQWQSGLPVSIFDDVTTPIPYLECRWLVSLRTFLSTIKGKIQLDNTYVVSCERNRDIYLMQYASTCGLFTLEDIKILNYCRLYLHITTLSELLEADGRIINFHIFHCHREPWFDQSTYVTLQRRPSEYHLRTKWQKLCRQFVTSEGRLAPLFRLGLWTKSGEKLRRRRETYIDNRTTSRTVFHWRRACYWEYQPSHTHQQHYVPLRPTTWVPTFPCTPIRVQTHSSGLIKLLHQPTHYRAPRPPPSPTSFHDYVHTLSDWEKHLLSGVNLLVSPYEIVHRLHTIDKKKVLYLVSDGSHMGDSITFGWVFGTEDGTIYAEHANYGFGTPTSHRAEAWGSLSAVIFLAHLQLFTNTSLSLSIPAPLFSGHRSLHRSSSCPFRIILDI